jgi:hypothetical protein
MTMLPGAVLDDRPQAGYARRDLGGERSGQPAGWSNWPDREPWNTPGT